MNNLLTRVQFTNRVYIFSNYQSFQTISFIPKEFITEKIIHKIISINPLEIYRVEKTMDLCKLAIDKDISSLNNIRDQTDEICWYALKRSINAIKYIHKPTYEMKLYSIDCTCSTDIFSEDENCERIRRNPFIINKFRHITINFLRL